MPRLSCLLLFAALSIVPLQLCQADELWDLSSLEQPPKFTWLDKTSPIRTLTYENEPYQGQTTDVFAFYATPGSISGDASLDQDLPAVVLIHGGGGTAFAEWAWLWAKRGYAAIAMDLSGRKASAPTVDAESGEIQFHNNHRDIDRSRLPHGGPEQGHVEKFTNAGGDLTDDWQYHAVAAVIRAHSLIRSFPEVDPERTAVTGISWGGYLTCIVASVDDRFKAAVPVYGCGFLYDGESVQRPQIESLPPEQQAEWIRLYEPSVWLPKCRVPIMFVNGTNDVHYPLVSYSRSYDLVAGPRTLRIEVNMPHGHPPGWKPEEIGLFVDQHLRGGVALPKVSEPKVTDGVVTATFKSELPVKSAALHYTTDTGRQAERKWHSAAATIEDKTVSASVPKDATVWMLSVTDSRDAMVSTEVMFAE